jgi:hypothetical protein
MRYDPSYPGYVLTVAEYQIAYEHGAGNHSRTYYYQQCEKVEAYFQSMGIALDPPSSVPVDAGILDPGWCRTHMITLAKVLAILDADITPDENQP